MRRKKRYTQRDADLSELSELMGRTLPPVCGSIGSYVIVVEDRQEHLTDSLLCIPSEIVQSAVIAAVGVLDPSAHPFLCAGVGSDVQKMAQVATWLASGRLPGPVSLLVPSHRGWLLNGILQQSLRMRDVSCETEAMGVPLPYGVDREGALEQVELVFRALEQGDIDCVPELESDGRLYAAYQRLKV